MTIPTNSPSDAEHRSDLPNSTANLPSRSGEHYYRAEAFAALARIEAGSFWFQSRNRIILSTLRRFTASNSLNYAEIGCGTGFVCRTTYRNQTTGNRKSLTTLTPNSPSSLTPAVAKTTGFFYEMARWFSNRPFLVGFGVHAAARNLLLIAPNSGFRVLSSQQARIDYRHLIDSLVRKPGAFARYLYREELFPRLVFRQAYDRLVATGPDRADRDYVAILALTAGTDEAQVADILGALLRAGEPPRADAIKLRLQTTPPPIRDLAAFVPELHSYDQLVQESVA